MKSKCANCRFGASVCHTVTEKILKPAMKKREEWVDDDDEDNMVPDPNGDPTIQDIEQNITTSFCYYHPTGEPTDEPIASFQVVDECSVFVPR